jgi:hypothetical protein
MSKWLDEKAERNRQALACLSKKLPAIFPPAVLARALSRPFIPPTPRLVIGLILARTSDSCRSISACSGGPQRGTGWLDVAAWGRPRELVTTDLPNAARAVSRTHLRERSRLLLRVRPARLSLRLACRSVGQRRQQERDTPSGEVRLLRRLQAGRCGQTGRRLWKSAEVDHRVPLFRVWSEHRDVPWPKLLDFWAYQIFR